MKPKVTLLLLIISCSVYSLPACSQDIFEDDTLDNSIKIKTTPGTVHPLYILKMKDKSYEFKDAKNGHPLDGLDPEMIERIDVYKGEKAIEQFGEKGNDGVVVITLKKSAYKNLSRKLRRKLS